MNLVEYNNQFENLISKYQIKYGDKVLVFYMLRFQQLSELFKSLILRENDIIDSNRKVPLLFVEFKASVPALGVLKKQNNYSDIFQLRMSDSFRKTCFSKDEYFWKRLIL